MAHRKFTKEFRQNAIQLVVEKGMPVGKVARELDVHRNLIHKWRSEYLAEGENARARSGKTTPETAEVKRLQKELEEVKEERDILKKALGVFTKCTCSQMLGHLSSLGQDLLACHTVIAFSTPAIPSSS